MLADRLGGGWLAHLAQRTADGARGASTALPPIDELAREDLEWAVGSVCNLNLTPFDLALFRERFSPPHHLGTLIDALEALSFKPGYSEVGGSEVDGSGVGALQALGQESLPVLVTLRALPGQPLPQAQDGGGTPVPRLALLARLDAAQAVLFAAGSNTPSVLELAQFQALFLGQVISFERAEAQPSDPDAPATQQPFGFGWFVPELLRHRTVWRDVLLASLLVQLLGLGTPLASQVILDKVVVHHSYNTLWVVAAALALCIVFGSALQWMRQYLVNHTGNRVDAALGSAVLRRLLSLPVRYFEMRPTGVIAARLRAVETIREFVSSAAVTLILDLPFLLVFVALMFYYHVGLTLLALALIALMVMASFVVAPLLQRLLNQEFLAAAANQAFVTEYVAGLETVKSLQMEARLSARYESLLAVYLGAAFKTRQLGNTYGTVISALEQALGTAILVVGAWVVMGSADFTIGMLVAFQMFTTRVSQPLMRLSGLWQQLQEARISVARLADIMDVAPEPYAVAPRRAGSGPGRIELQDLGFRYAPDRPWLFRGLDAVIEPGRITMLVGTSGSGKSTLTKLLQGFYAPGQGRILVDGRDISTLYANELRGYFGVVPQETVLFGGTVYDNLTAGNALAGFEQVVQACRMAEIHEVIEALPQGYQTLLGERGMGLSGGQRQRLAIARALLKNPKVLILDEAVSNLDADTAEQVAATIQRLRGRVTIVFITHQMPRSLKPDAVVRVAAHAQQRHGTPQAANSNAGEHD